MIPKMAQNISNSKFNNDQRKNAVSSDRGLKSGENFTFRSYREIKENEIKNQNVLANESIENVKYMNFNKNLTNDAIDIIKNSLINVSEMLNLDITNYPAFTEYNPGGFSDNVLEQISEILYSLNSLTDLLDHAVKNNMSLEIRGNLVNPRFAPKLFHDLQSEIFNLGMALKMAGISGEVSRIVAKKMDKLFVYGGIPQASDPQSLSMSESQLKHLFNSQGHDNKKQMDSVIGRIIALIKEDEKTDLSKKKLLTINGLKNGNNVVVESSADRNSVSSQILRRLLKIDGDVDTHQGGQSKDATIEEKQNNKTPLNIFLRTKGTVNKNIKEAFALVKNSSDSISGMDASAKNSGQFSVELNGKLPSVTTKSLEESVIKQITQRFHSAIKNGIHEIRLVLRPESLGDVRMTIQMERDIVTARIQVENQQVKQIIESNLNSLKDSLEEQNLRAGSFDVDINRNSRDGEQGFGELSGKTGASEENDEKDSTSSEGIQKHSGVNKGRRFGSNSIEYFA